MQDIPVIDTPRLRLRGFTAADFPRYAEIWRDPAVVRHILPGPRSETDSWRAFLGIAGGWAICGHGQWAVELRDSGHDTGRIIGTTGFFQARRGLGPDFDGLPECGWVLAQGAWGKGLGTEAVTAAHRWFDASPHGPATVCMIEAGHAGSERIAARMGYARMRLAEMDGPPVALLRRDGAPG